jgi:hypothetical protein
VDQGRIQVNVSVLDVGRPADAAVVRITPRNGENIVEEMMTDTSGQTPITELPAPPLEFSQVPGSPMPYSEYDVYVTMEGYKPVRVEGTQILPDSLAIQNVNLEPAEAPPAGPENVPIQPHTLYGIFPPKIPESEVKPLPDSSGFVVLPQPVVPEFVVVHLGVPTDPSARNVWVTFQDYIKNVASCEIYSTWPEETIKANVLAILSFTMNRIYTEWYRGRGFDFTITNSTAFDQAFNYGRNIFDNISMIVDDIFTTYITRPGIRQPLLTQYCDGTRVQCPGWLTQWGSKYLGDQGYDAISILRNFYGQDVFLMAADRVSGVPVSYPGAVLQLGSTGPAVRTIQEQLNAISNNYPAINKVRVDGEFGEQTRTAVETFQGIFNLPRSGIVDFATWYKISAIYVAVTRMAEL